MAFKFRFQSVLNYRRHQAEVAEMELAKAQRELAVAAERLEHLRLSKRDCGDQLAHCLQQGVTGRELQLWRVYLTDVETKIEEETQRMENMKLAVENLRAKLLDATRRKKGMEQLLHRGRQAWQREEERRQEKELSELAVQQHMRRSS